MAQIFHPSTNTLSKISIFGAVFLIGGLLWVFGVIERSSYVTQAKVVREQPVPFSHRHHVSQLGIDCRYCHTSVEESGFAGIPATKTCMTCHSQIHSSSPMLEPVRESFRNNKSIAWVRVNDLPDFVYFNHAIHVKKGMSCVTCHGPVDEMALTWRENALTMEWCLSCHRAPERFVRPREFVFSTDWKPAEDQAVLGAKLVREYKIQKLTNCSICHR
ncbi:MAG: cytochrome c family protein [candidate division KSB1 bacterium]|nr:cytochrome c family protein [candidate division KSB1 bacterium]MDZ7300801.1 cytochrome c family protein [candidate division KSB1 bacterium]MDZ7309928.1 cytochrome c family protein [candidate division KSB1 bacterium]